MVPKAARAGLGKAEFTKSLGVSDRREAEALAYPVLAQWRAQVDAVLRPTPPQSGAMRVVASERDVDDYLASYFDDQSYIHTFFAQEHIQKTGRDFDQEQEVVGRSKRLLLSVLFAGDVNAYLPYLESELAKSGFSLPAEREVRERYARKALQALVDSYSSVEAGMEGRADEFRPAKFITDAKKRASDGGESRTIMALFERYAAQRLAEGRRPDGVDQDRIVVERFAQFVGSKRPLSSITRNDVRDWRDAVAALPLNFTNSTAYRGLDMRAAAAKAKVAGTQGLSATTQNKYLSTVSPLFRWAVQNGYADGNPCDGLFLKVDKQANPYPTFTPDELNKIVSSPLFTGFLRDGAEHKPGNVQAADWRKWVPLLCIFTGSRIGEMAQLWTDDIRHEHGRWFVHIRHDPGRGQGTKSGKGRIVPVHRTLEASGFVEFVANRRATAGEGSDKALFDGLAANERGHIGHAPSRFWRRYLGKIGIKEGADGKGAHSFRHTLTDELRAAGFLDDQFGPLILGHRKASVTAGYGRMPQGTADMLCAMIDGVRFKGVDFSPLLPAAGGAGISSN